jgi:hypothetical protein
MGGRDRQGYRYGFVEISCVGYKKINPKRVRPLKNRNLYLGLAGILRQV